ncbi:MAG: FIST signal transduction protein, partial [Gemmatimonadota bacterium]
MTDSKVVFTDISESSEAGTFLGAEISRSFKSRRPDALIVFASSKYDHSQLLEAIERACRPKIIVGCSSAGEFISNTLGEGSACAVALRAPEMHFAAGIGNHLRADRAAAAEQIVSSFVGLNDHNYSFHSALVLTDALAGHADDLVERLNLLTAGTYSLFGGGAGDDARFSRTHVFYGTEAYPDAAVALEILSNKPVGVGVSHAWEPTGAPMRVTEAEGMRLISLNASPAVEIFQEHAEVTGQRFELEDPMPFFLHNVIGISTGDGYKLRVPLAVNPDG